MSGQSVHTLQIFMSTYNSYVSYCKCKKTWQGACQVSMLYNYSTINRTMLHSFSGEGCKVGTGSIYVQNIESIVYHLRIFMHGKVSRNQLVFMQGNYFLFQGCLQLWAVFVCCEESLLHLHAHSQPFSRWVKNTRWLFMFGKAQVIFLLLLYWNVPQRGDHNEPGLLFLANTVTIAKFSL